MSEMIDMSEGAMRRILNDRIEELEAKLARYNDLVADKIDLQSENIALKAKLAKAVKCLQSLIIEYDKVDLAYDEPKSMTAVYSVALNTLAELTGEPKC